jgi:hypothetical protein
LLTGREADSDDLDALEAFHCAGTGEPWASDVESYIPELLGWRSAGGPGRRVRLYEDESGLVAVAAYKRMREDPPEEGFFIFVIAVRADRRRDRLGTSIFRGLVEHFANIEPGGVVAWMVDPANIASAALSAKFAGDEPISDWEWPHYLEYSATLPK